MTRAPAIKLLAAVLCTSVIALSAPSASRASDQRAVPKYAYGIDTYLTWNCAAQAAQIDQWATTEATEFKDLGANWIGIGFPLYTESIHSNDIYAANCDRANSNYQSPSPAILGGVVMAVHAVGLKVLLRPLLDQTNLYPNYWRGVISPTDRKMWFFNYRAALVPYLRVAATDHVQSLAIMTELDSLVSDRAEWNDLRTWSRKLYRGELVWDVSWNMKAHKVTLAGASSAMDTYPNLPSLPVTASPPQVAAAWDGLLQQPAYSVPKISGTTIDEVGISAQDGAYADPSNFALPLQSHPFNQAIQANWFSAACRFMKEHHMGGIFYWGPFLTTDDGTMLSSPDPGAPGNIQPLSQRAIARCFSA